MKKFKIITVIFLILAFTSASGVIYFSNMYKSLKQKHTETNSYENRLLNSDEWIYGDFTASWRGINFSKSGEHKVINYETPRLAKANNTVAYIFAGAFLLLSIFYFLLIYFTYKNTDLLQKTLTLGLIFTAIAALFAGLLSPMMEISAFKHDMQIAINIKKFSLTKDFPGDMYFYYQSKSIVELVWILFKGKNIFVAVCIFLFSIVVPVTKLVYSLKTILNPASLNNKFANFVINKIGKWSMADVFVVAVYLAYLSYNNLDAGVTTKSNTLVGLYFFLAYCILSISSSYFIKKNNKIL